MTDQTTHPRERGMRQEDLTVACAAVVHYQTGDLEGCRAITAELRANGHGINAFIALVTMFPPADLDELRATGLYAAERQAANSWDPPDRDDPNT